MTNYSDFAEKLLIAIYQDTEGTGEPYQRVGPILHKYGIEYKPLWISQVAEEWEHLYFSGISRVLSRYEDWSFRISAQGVRYIESKYGDKDGVGEILEPIDHDAKLVDTIIPASDRVVKIGDNFDAASSARLAIANLSAQLSTANDIGGFSQDEIEEARREVWILEQTIKQDAVRVEWIEPLAKACLQWIAKKAAEEVVGSFAKAALSALAILFGFSI